MLRRDHLPKFGLVPDHIGMRFVHFNGNGYTKMVDRTTNHSNWDIWKYDDATISISWDQYTVRNCTTNNSYVTKRLLRFPIILFCFLCHCSCRCVLMRDKFNCGRFDLDSLATDSAIYPLPWKFAMVFMVLGFIIMTITTLLTLATFCRQSIFGKSIHTITGSAQAIAGRQKAFSKTHP